MDNTNAIVPVENAGKALLLQAMSEAQINVLKQRTPKKERKTRPGRGNKTFTYVEHGWVTEQLNLAFGWNWDFRILDKEVGQTGAVVTGQLTVRTASGQTIVKEQFGEKEQNGGMTRGSLLKAAGSDALKKCASLLGLALDLYRGEGEYHEEEEYRKPAPPSTPKKPKSPIDEARNELGKKLKARGLETSEERASWVVQMAGKPPEALTLDEWLDLSASLD